MTRSAKLDFFAVEADLRSLFDFLFTATDVRVFESYSEYGAELREFCSTDELAATFPLGVDPGGNGFAVTLQLWSPSVMDDLTITRFALNPGMCHGHTFRYLIEGGGLMQLYLGGVCKDSIIRSHFGHQSEARARAWDVGEGVDWEALKKISNRIQYHIRKRMAVGMVETMPVLLEAWELAKTGYALKHSIGSPWVVELSSTRNHDTPDSGTAMALRL